MSKLKIRQGDWVIVCDGRKALVLENAGDEKFLNLKTREVFDHPDQKTQRARHRCAWPIVQLGRATDAAPWSRPIGTPRKRSASCRTLAGHLDAEVKAGRDEVNRHRRAAARARRVAPGLFARPAQGVARRDRQGLRDDAGARDREALSGVVAHSAHACESERTQDFSSLLTFPDRIASPSLPSARMSRTKSRTALARADLLRVVGGEHDARGRDFDHRRSSPT